MPSLELYRFTVRNSANGKWLPTRHPLTIKEAHKRYGEGNYKIIEESRQAREIDARWQSMAHLATSIANQTDA